MGRQLSDGSVTKNWFLFSILCFYIIIKMEKTFKKITLLVERIERCNRRKVPSCFPPHQTRISQENIRKAWESNWKKTSSANKYVMCDSCCNTTYFRSICNDTIGWFNWCSYTPCAVGVKKASILVLVNYFACKCNISIISFLFFVGFNISFC